MRPSRRTLLILLALAVAAVAAVVAALVLTGGGEKQRKPGRVAVVAGCGLEVMNPDGSGRRQLCLPGIFAGVTVSGNGKTIAWDTRSSIVVADADATRQRTPGLPTGANVEPSLSPDGGRLAFLHSARNDGRYDVWTASTSGEAAKRLTTGRNASAVSWSPSGDRIAFVTGWNPDTLEGQVYSMDTSGGDLRLLGPGDGPVWSRDGKQLAFTHDGAIWTMKAEGTGKRRVAEDGHAPAWSRDGRLLAFMRATKCARPPCAESALVIPPGGGSEKAVGPPFADASRVVWLPNGK